MLSVYQRKHRSWRKRIIVIVLCVLVVTGVIVGAIIAIRRYHPQPEITFDHTPSKPQTLGKSVNDTDRFDNEARQSDAIALQRAVHDYAYGNAAAYPTGFSGGKLTGGEGTKPQPVGLSYYKKITIVSGVQAGMRATDELRLVTKAKCAPSGGATVISSGEQVYVIQYMLKNQSGSFDPQCRVSA